MTDSAVVSKKILVVEDSKDISGLLGEILEDEGYLVFYAENGNQAIAQAFATQPQLILMDLSLPELNGWEVVKRLRTASEFYTTPIIAVTAYASTSDRHRAMSIGCTDYISKPFDIDMMLKRVGELLRGK